MAGAADGERSPNPTVPDPAWSRSHPLTQPSGPDGTAPAFPATDTDTDTVTSPPPGGSRDQGDAPARSLAPSSAQRPASGSRPAEIVRHGPGVPASAPASQAGPTAEEVWRTGLPGGRGRKRSLRRRLVGPAITVIL